ncbi:MAG: hypothetical protein ACRD2L_18950 [Terriglobia bacterium]
MDLQVRYNEEQLMAELDCPLCGQRWVYPFPAREISGKPCPTPHQIVSFHLYGCGMDPEYCAGFDPAKHRVAAVNETTLRIATRHSLLFVPRSGQENLREAPTASSKRVEL